jgi:hypothetical protein
MVRVMLKRNMQGKFALKNDDYRQVGSLRLTEALRDQVLQELKLGQPWIQNSPKSS